MLTYRLFSQFKKYTKPIQNLNITNNQKKINKFFKDNKEPPLNISIMDPNFSDTFWKMYERDVNKNSDDTKNK